jgi:yecA family protein
MDTLAGATMPSLPDDLTGRSFALLEQAERDRIGSLLRPLAWIDGLTTAMVIAPDMPGKPDEVEGGLDWLDHIWREDKEDEVGKLTLPQCAGIVAPVMDHYCHVANVLLEAPESYRPYLAGRSDPMEVAAHWADGFRVGITLEPDAWSLMFVDEDALSLLVVIFSLLREEDLPDELSAESPFRDMPAERRDSMRRAAVDMLPELVLALHDHALGMSSDEDDELDVEGAAIAGAHAPHMRAEPNVGRNDPCPCGSGKKYKKCCLG